MGRAILLGSKWANVAVTQVINVDHNEVGFVSGEIKVGKHQECQHND
jgi:hypothetical protein